MHSKRQQRRRRGLILGLTLGLGFLSAGCENAPEGEPDARGLDRGTPMGADARAGADAAWVPASDGGRDAAPVLDAALDPIRDATVDAAQPPDGAADGSLEADARPAEADGAPPGPDAEAPPPAPVDCAPLARAGVELCHAGADRCEAVFRDGTGCEDLCRAAGLRCVAGFEDVDGACAADHDREALGCAETGHRSDYCVCARAADCRPACEGRACGLDGCGGRRGDCAGGEACQAGRCVASPLPACDDIPARHAHLMAERAGFGRQTTGGDPRNVYRVRNRNATGQGSLRAGLERAESTYIVFDVDGEIRLNARVDLRSNKTVDGRGRDVRIVGRLRLPAGTRNIILTDLSLTSDVRRDGDDDLIEIVGRAAARPQDFETRDIWLHHLELFHAGDGLVDVRGASRITVSWCHLHTHTKGMLQWRDRDNAPAPGMQMTYHHNLFDRISRRGPHFHYGLADFVNNYQYEWYEYGAASVQGAQFLSEANIYEARPGDFCVIPCPDPAPHGGGRDFIVSKQALVPDWAAENDQGYIRSVGDVLLNGARVVERQPERVFQRADHYPLEVEPAGPELAASIRQEAGPRPMGCQR